MERLVSPAAARARPRRQRWFADFLRRELAPYPGRISTVARMVIAATLTMLILQTFHLPAGALGGFFALLFSRENLRASVYQALGLALFFLLGTTVSLVCFAMFLDSPVTHFLLVITAFYLLFFIMDTARNYGFASGFSFTMATAIPLWDGPGEVNHKVALTLYSLLAVSIGAGCAILVESVYRAFQPIDPVLEGIADRLRVAGETLGAAADGQLPARQTRAMVLQYAEVGASTLRQQMVRAGETAFVRARGTAVIALSDRIVEICARALPSLETRAALDRATRTRLAALSHAILQQARRLQKLPDVASMVDLRLPDYAATAADSTPVPALPELERTAHLLSEICNTRTIRPARRSSRHREANAAAPAGRRTLLHTLFVSDAFTSREHQQFALRGCIAATLCYLIYNGVDWPGISTSLATCIITALATIGASRQKQALRILGAIVGGFCIALPAQMFLLPHMDSISAFALFFAAVMVIAAWVATSSPRLSYAGLQIALAFDLVNLQESTFQISLSVARDRVVGVLLGLAAMWLVFDQFGGRRAGESMIAMLQDMLGTLAELNAAYCSFRRSGDRKSVVRLERIRARINAGFTQMNGQADGVIFEFGPLRTKHLRERDRMRTVQPALRSTFLILITLFETTGYAHDTFPGDPLIPLLETHRRALLEVERYSVAKIHLDEGRAMHASVAAMEQALAAARETLRAHSPTLLNLCISLLAALHEVENAVWRSAHMPGPLSANSTASTSASALPAS
jgi:multidrug resistance protein MdtO